ncbi:cupin domain-containing protein (plasmid) [Rhizobium sp. TH2]|uniref:cupin domain-containing protein n=1 Tax=Rhizobium sp. TH2 TaxID=2775403 RepID=UPI002158A047|nr:cupin domain-containing protein [Rhizobium sp. TH2]UVC12632.1 cupin domain-containing protein [Rhizobium sp. TH2]
MHQTLDVAQSIAGLTVGITTSAADQGIAKLNVIHRQSTDALPIGRPQEIRVIKATLEPGDRTPYHSHRFPVTVYMLGGEFTLELDDHPPVTLAAGDVFIEPADVRMTGSNRRLDVAATMVLFYVSDPDTPFADPVA